MRLQDALNEQEIAALETSLKEKESVSSLSTVSVSLPLTPEVDAEDHINGRTSSTSYLTPQTMHQFDELQSSMQITHGRSNSDYVGGRRNVGRLSTRGPSSESSRCQRRYRAGSPGACNGHSRSYHETRGTCQPEGRGVHRGARKDVVEDYYNGLTEPRTKHTGIPPRPTLYLLPPCPHRSPAPLPRPTYPQRLRRPPLRSPPRVLVDPSRTGSRPSTPPPTASAAAHPEHTAPPAKRSAQPSDSAERLGQLSELAERATGHIHSASTGPTALRAPFPPLALCPACAEAWRHAWRSSSRALLLQNAVRAIPQGHKDGVDETRRARVCVRDVGGNGRWGHRAASHLMGEGRRDSAVIAPRVWRFAVVTDVT